MKWVVLILGTLTLGLIALAIWVSPPSNNYPPVVNRESQIKYELGEKIKASPYGNWLDGEVSAITSEDEYVVHYCGPIGWFHGWVCETETLRRSQMAKIQQPEQ